MKETYNKIVNNKAFQIVKKLLSICLTVVLVLVFFIILVQKLSNNRFNLGGYGIYTIATGSMEPEYKVKDFRLFDKVRYKNKEYFVFGRRNSGFFDIRNLQGEKVNKGSISYRKIKFLETSNGYLTERRLAGST